MYQNDFQQLQSHGQRVLNQQPSLKNVAIPRQLTAGGLQLDCSRQWLDEVANAALAHHAKQARFNDWRAALAAGEVVNSTEAKAATHLYCRAALAPKQTSLMLIPTAAPIISDYAKQAQEFLAFAKAFRAGQLYGATGQVLTDYVHLGIGGSDLGPRCVVQALKGLPQLALDDQAQHVHFVGNLDPDDFANTVRYLNPATTLFGIASKSFNTLETQANAKLAQAWLAQHLGNVATAAHFCAMTAAPDKASAFLGLNVHQAQTRLFAMANTVGGRYSLWSCIGLPIAMAFGADVFSGLCEGAVELDEHFLNTPFTNNLPAQLGAIQVWNSTVLGLRCQPTIAYSHRLALLPAHLQQLDMESNGKSVDVHGKRLSYPTSPAILGGVGTPAQHAFFQWMHQGTDNTANVFIGVHAKHHVPDSLSAQAAQDVALCLEAQANVLWQGGCFQKAGLLEQHGVYAGGRPVSVLMLQELTPQTLGALIATFEHAVYTAAVLWGINPFDQWGVELGKQLYAQAKGSTSN